MATPAATTRAHASQPEPGQARRMRKSTQMIFRLTPELKTLFEDAAAISGRSVTDFVTEAARERAIQVVQDNQDYVVWKLAGEDARAFAEAITGPPRPNPRLKVAYDKYRQMTDLRRSVEPPPDERAG